MFIAQKNEILLHPLEKNLVSIPIIELAFVHPLFLCEVLELEGCIDSRISTPKLVPSLEGLTDLTLSHKIVNAFLLSPGYMNHSERWALTRLINVSKAEYFFEGCTCFVYRFELENGNFLDYDISGLNKNRNDLRFECILNLSEA